MCAPAQLYQLPIHICFHTAWIETDNYVFKRPLIFPALDFSHYDLRLWPKSQLHTVYCTKVISFLLIYFVLSIIFSFCARQGARQIGIGLTGTAKNRFSNSLCLYVVVETRTLLTDGWTRLGSLLRHQEISHGQANFERVADAEGRVGMEWDREGGLGPSPRLALHPSANSRDFVLLFCCCSYGVTDF